jgi:hypothetical protein
VIQFETSFDNFHPDKDRIYQIVDKSKTDDGYQYGSGIPLPLVKAMRNDFPQLKIVAGISHVRDVITIPGNDVFLGSAQAMDTVEQTTCGIGGSASGIG